MDRSVACSYQLTTQKWQSLVISDLLAKEMKAATSAGAAATESIPEFLYQTEWQASQPVLPAAAAANGVLKVTLQPALGGAVSAARVLAAISASGVIAVGGRASNTPAMVNRSVQITSSASKIKYVCAYPGLYYTHSPYVAPSAYNRSIYLSSGCWSFGKWAGAIPSHYKQLLPTQKQ